MIRYCEKCGETVDPNKRLCGDCQAEQPTTALDRAVLDAADLLEQEDAEYQLSNEWWRILHALLDAVRARREGMK